MEYYVITEPTNDYNSNWLDRWCIHGRSREFLPDTKLRECYFGPRFEELSACPQRDRWIVYARIESEDDHYRLFMRALDGHPHDIKLREDQFHSLIPPSVNSRVIRMIKSHINAMRVGA